MRSKVRQIEVRKMVNLGRMPTFLSMMHRHLEKENSGEGDGGTSFSGTVTFNVPVDLLSLTISDKALLREVESVALTYRSK